MVSTKFPVSQDRSVSWKNQAVPALIGLLALAVPMVVAPLDDPRWHGLRTAGFEAGAALLLAMLLALPGSVERRKQWAEAGRALPFRLLAVLFLWGCLSAFLAPAKAFAVQGLFLWGAGIVIALAVAAEARARPQYEMLLHALTGATFLISLTGFALYGANHMPLAVGLYYDHMLYGAVFTILLPIMLAISLSPVPTARRLPAQAALAAGLAALGMSQTRSAWVGFAVSLLVFAGLTLFARAAQPRAQGGGADQRGQRIQAMISGLLVLGVLVYFISAVPQIGDVGERLRTLTTTVPQGKEESVEWRFTAWQGAERMVMQKPWLGWGIGGYPLYQHDYTGMGPDTDAVAAQGATIFDEAHNSYLQIAAEMGFPALLLWLSIIVSTLVLGISCLRRFPPGNARQWALIGCLSALVGQAADALANPGWQFGEVSLFLWIALGLTVALALGPPERSLPSREGTRAAALVLGIQSGKILLAALVGCGLVWVILQTMSILPAPKL